MHDKDMVEKLLRRNKGSKGTETVYRRPKNPGGLPRSRPKGGPSVESPAGSFSPTKKGKKSGRQDFLRAAFKRGGSDRRYM